MASFTQKIENKYGATTYSETKNTYDWIMKALSRTHCEKIDTEFLFDIADIFCSCNSIEEFVENAYGQPAYKLVSMKFSIASENEPLWFVSVDPFNQVRITTSSKRLLEEVVKLLENTTLADTEIDDPISVAYIDKFEQHVGSVVIGDYNTVANDHSAIVTNVQPEKPHVRKWISGILQGLTTNVVWWLLGIVLAGIAVCCGLNL